ncbi:MAG: flagellar basal body P-ring protein FlgI [Desulfobulbaceae bacterium]|nr:flagellar basal body P-ring protein FlgI [Desulfobulbaceae bacterium]
MNRTTLKKLTKIMSIWLLLFAVWPPAHSNAVRLKDLASVKGVRNNQLIGYGLVVGLNGTGDGNQVSFTSQGLANMMENMGIHMNKEGVQVKNVASVLITAQLPPFVKVGQTIDVTLSSLGDASSLQGGTLIATPLKGLDNKIYALAQGAVSIGGFEVTGRTMIGTQKNHLTVARIPNGATVEREVPVSFKGKGKITLSLNQPDFTTVYRMVSVIDDFLKGPYTSALDGATVEITIPEHYSREEIGMLAEIENLDVRPDSRAKVVIDERTGTIVLGQNVQINEIAVSHGNLSLQVNAGQAAPAGGAGLGAPVSNDNITAREKENRLLALKTGATLGEVVRALNSVGVTPRDLISIFQTIKASGALQAELEII